MEETLQGIDALLITNPTNIRYATGFIGAAPEEREAYAVLTKKRIFLFAGALYRQQAKTAVSRFRNTPVSVIEMNREHPFSEGLAAAMVKMRIKRLGFEEANLTIMEYNALKQTLPNITLVPTRDRIEAKRMIKKPDEIASIRASARLTDNCFSFVRTKIQPGVTEAEIVNEITSFLLKHGAETAFSPIVAFGDNSAQPHYQSKLSRQQCRTNDIILLDFGARVHGYCADMTRVMFTGKPKQTWIRTYQAVLAAHDAALRQLKNGVRSGAALDTAAREVIEKAGLPTYPHSLGHAVGLGIHESPRISMQKDAALSAGMTVTVEPGVYLPGRYGIRIEDLVLITETGIDVLSTSPTSIITNA